MLVLCVAEKPSIALAIAKALCEGSFKTEDGATPVHKFEGSFEGSPAHFQVTSVTGHIYGCDFAGSKFQSWESDPEILFDAPVEKTLSGKNSGRICKHLQNHAKGVHVLILWLDCDREGENICFEVLENTDRFLAPKARILRAKFSSITENDIKKAMLTLGKPNQNEAKAVDARQELDLKVGVAFTRFQTRFFQEKYGNLNSKLISYGPCQIPTLFFCVRRHDEIQQFSPEKFWKLYLTLPGVEHRFAWSRARMFSRPIAEVFRERISQARFCTIAEISRKTKTIAKPGPLNTVGMLKAASSSLGMSPSETMHVAESLYLRGSISYPRTETTKYPDGYDFKSDLKHHSTHPHWGSYVSSLHDVHIPKGGDDAGDHPPIMPTKCVHPDDLSGDAWRLYDFICRNYFASISASAKTEVTTVVLKICDEEFSASSTKLIASGFLELIPRMAPKREIDFPAFLVENEVIEISGLDLCEGETEPPTHLSESELIGMMEHHGIGTDASISVHISNICERNYVKLGTGRQMVPTDLGIVLIHGYLKIDPELATPQLRSYIEKQVSLIAKGKATYEQVLNYALDVFRCKFVYFRGKIEKMDLLFSAHFSTVESTSGRLLSKCGKCKRWMKYIALRPERLYCSTCEDTYLLPSKGKIGLYMGRICPLDNFELIYYNTTGQKAISYPLCPFCYNNPPFEDIGKDMACNRCMHPTCKYGYYKNQVYTCMEDSCSGDLIFDSSSGPNWRMCCNKCNIVVQLTDTAHKLARLEERCEDCSAALFAVEFHKDKIAPGAEASHIGCFFCDPLLNQSIKTVLGAKSKFSAARSKRGRGRGRRGRGRRVIVDPRMTFDRF